MVNANQTEVGAVRHALGGVDPYEERTYQPGAVGNRNSVAVGQPHPGVSQGLLNDRTDGPDVRPGRQLRHDTTIASVILLGKHHV